MPPSTPEASLSHGLPPLQPAVVVNLLDALAGSPSIPDQVVRICDTDPALAAWLLESHAQQERRLRIPTLEQALKQVKASSLKTLAVQEAVRLLSDPGHFGEREAAWQRALHCASLCAAFAGALNDPTPHEAYLAGLLHNLGQGQDNAGWQGLAQEQDAAWAERVESWQYQSFLADALRYQRWPAESLQDASSLVQILWAARSLVDDTDDNGQLPILLGLSREKIAELHAQAGADAENAHETLSGLLSGNTARNCPERLMRALSRYAALEHLVDTLGGCQTLPQAVASLARHLIEVHGLTHPLHFTLDGASGKLVSRPLPGLAQLDLGIPVENSNAALARAHRQAAPVITWRGATQPPPSLLDEQIARLAHADGLLAIPLGPQARDGVLLACGERGRLAQLQADPGYLVKLGGLSAHLAPRQVAPAGAAAEGDSPLARWQAHARRVAHEINNPLGIIKNYLALMRLKMDEANATQDDLRVINEELDRIGGIVQGLVSEGSTTLPEVSDIDVNGLLADLVKVATPGLMSSKQIGLDLALEPQLPRVRSDRDKLKQLLINLLLNAIEAAPERGNVRLATHRSIDHNQKRLVEILISNPGEPIDAERMSRLFEPVETRKGGVHAGLGLSIVKALATDLAATVACRSHDRTTTFQVILPVE